MDKTVTAIQKWMRDFTNVRQLPWASVQWVLGLALLSALILSVDWSQFLQLLANAKAEFILLALACSGVSVLVSAFRWQGILAAERVHVPLLRLVRYYLISLFLNNYLPPLVGADAVRMVALKETSSKGVRFVSVLVERGLGLLSLLMFAVIALVFNNTLADYPIIGVAIAVSICGVLTLLTLMLYPNLWSGGLHYVQRIPVLHINIGDVARAGRNYRQHPIVLTRAFLLSCLIQVLAMSAFAFRALVFGIALSPWELVLIVPIIVVLSMLPISPGGLGSREAFYILMLGLVGIDSQSAIAVALLARLLDLFIASIGGILWLRPSNAKVVTSP